MNDLIDAMKVVLGTAFAFYFKSHAFHWNVEGPTFVSLHKLFEEIYEDTWESVDAIAEQIRQLDAYTPCAMQRFISLSKITSENNVLPAHDMIVMLMKDSETLIEVLTLAGHLATSHDKQGLANFIGERIEMHTKWRWQLRATAKS